MLFCKGFSKVRQLCNYTTAWNFHLSAFLYSTPPVLGFQPANKRQYIAIFLIRLCCWQYDNPCVRARLTKWVRKILFLHSKPMKNIIWILAKDTALRASLVIVLQLPYTDCGLRTSAWLVVLASTPCCWLVGGRKSCVCFSEIPREPAIFPEQ